jgi:hypothetical protein
MILTTNDTTNVTTPSRATDTTEAAATTRERKALRRSGTVLRLAVCAVLAACATACGAGDTIGFERAEGATPGDPSGSRAADGEPAEGDDSDGASTSGGEDGDLSPSNAPEAGEDVLTLADEVIAALAQHPDLIEFESPPEALEVLSSRSDARLTTTGSTFFKARVEDSTKLAARDKCAIAAGTVLELAGAPQAAAGQHLRVELKTAIPGCAFTSGFVWKPHVATLATARVTANTVFKREPKDSSVLGPTQKCTIASGSLLALQGDAEDAPGQHARVRLAGAPEGCGFNVGYLFKPHVTLPAPLRPQPSPTPPPTPAPSPESRVLLDVPYYYQYANRNRPSGTCNITSVAMAVTFLGRTVTPDQIFTDAHRVRRKTGAVYDSGAMALIGRQYGFAGSRAIYNASADTLKAELRKGRPIALQGYFTNWQFGHILLLIGFDKDGWFVNDPAGKWNGNTGNNAYAGRTPTNGRRVHYSYAAVARNSLAGGGKYHVAVFAK